MINASSYLQNLQVKFWEMCKRKPKLPPGEYFVGHAGNFI